jgi:hypothetical protein
MTDISLLFFFIIITIIIIIFFFFFFFLRGPSAYDSGSTSALWLIVLSPYYTVQLSPPVPRGHAT